MLVPDLVDDLARRDWCRRNDGEKAEAAVGINGRARVLKPPAMVTREPAREIQRCVGFEIVLLDTSPELPSRKGPKGLVRVEDDLELRSLQRMLPMIAHK